MKHEWKSQTLSVAVVAFLFAGITMAEELRLAQEEIDWPAFMQLHDMTLDTLPRSWKEAPHFGNAMVGSMLYQAGNTIRLQIFRAEKPLRTSKQRLRPVL